MEERIASGAAGVGSLRNLPGSELGIVKEFRMGLAEGLQLTESGCRSCAQVVEEERKDLGLERPHLALQLLGVQ